MEIPPLLLQTGGSLAAILTLYLLARALRLGGNPVLADLAAVKVVAGQVEDGFVAQRVSIARGGTAALAVDGAGRIMVIKRHGNRFAGRILPRTAIVREQVDSIEVDPGDPRFGKVRLALTDPNYWVDAINRL